MKLLKVFFTILFPLLFISCDPVFWANINNNTENDIFIELYYNRTHFENNWGKRSFIPYLEGVGRGIGIERIRFDTTNLISVFKVNKKTSFCLEGGIGNEPKFDQYSKIIIISNDTLLINNKVKFDKAWKKNLGNHFNININR